jgi:hypothetical protein
MAGLTGDIKTIQYGVPENSQIVAYPIGATAQLYSGAVALISGTGGTVTQGYLKNAATGSASDIVAGIVGDYAGGTAVAVGPGLLGGSTDGAVWANVRTGTFYIQSGTGSNALTEASVGSTVYYGGENANGPIANKTQGATPALGILLPQDPGITNNPVPGSTYWPVKLSTVGGP